MTRPRRHPSGFTFMEVLVAIVTIGFVVTGLAAAVVAALKSPNLARENGQADYVARRIMDETVAERRSNGLSKVISQNAAQLAAKFPDAAECGGSFVCALSVTLPAPGSNGCPATAAAGECRLAALTVTGPSGGVIRLTTLFIKYEQI